jgi:hypothetical protein
MSAERERVLILAASIDQAETYARRWVSEGENRGKADAIYLADPSKVTGLILDDQIRIVEVDGAWRNPHDMEIRGALARTIAKTDAKVPAVVERVEV